MGVCFITRVINMIHKSFFVNVFQSFCYLIFSNVCCFKNAFSSILSGRWFNILIHLTYDILFRVESINAENTLSLKWNASRACNDCIKNKEVIFLNSILPSGGDTEFHGRRVRMHQASTNRLGSRRTYEIANKII